MKLILLVFALLVWLGSTALLPAATFTVTTTDNSSGPGDGQTSLNEAIQVAQAGDTIAFNIPGAGPHIIQTPLGGYPLITVDNLTIDGYTQPGSSPNTHSILGGNNAQIKIVLDSTGADSASNPLNPNLPLRRSTRLPYSGYGDSENGIIAVLGADNFKVRGISFLGRVTQNSDDDPKIYCVALVQEAMNARVQGCWFGLAPGGSTQADVKGCGAAVAAYRFRDGGDVYSQGLVFGTDGDGVNDVAEFNIVLGMNIALSLELPNTKISGNYFNVFPSGTNFLDIDAYYDFQVTTTGGDSDTLENFENGRLADNTIIGTDGDGISDANERNIFNHAVYDHEIEIYSGGTNIVIAGNYFGVGVDGVTRAPVSTNQPVDLVELPGRSSIRVGSNGDGTSDDLEGNLIVNGSGSDFVVAGSSVPIVARRNKMVNNNYQAVPFAEGQDGRSFGPYYAPFVADSSMVVPVITAFTNNVLAGSMTGPNGVDYTAAFIDVYTVDPVALAKTNYWPAPITHPLRWLATFTDNGAGDLDPAANQFTFNLSSFGLSAGTYVTVAVTYSKDANASNLDRAITGPTALPVSQRPVLSILYPQPDKLVLSWLGIAGVFIADQNDTLNPNTWSEIFGSTPVYTSGRNIEEIPVDSFTPPTLFFRLRSQ